ncbi:MAG: hypothetical protein ACJ789_02435 [Thermomicrobiales bacterium]
MSIVRRRRWLTFFGIIVLAFLVVTGGFGFWLADEAGRLPWQEDPTRVAIAITPFADIPGFSAPTAVPNTTPTPTS